MEHAGRLMRTDGPGRAARFGPAGMLALSLAALLCTASASRAQDDDVVKIGVLNDMSGLYSDIGGAGSVAAAKLAVEDFNPAAHGMKVEVVSGDHQNKPDVGANLARQWYDADHVDAIFDVPTSSVALAVSEVTREKNKVFVGSGPASSDLTGPKCSPNTVHWTYDTWMLANGTGKAVVQTGGDTWFFLTADYAFGQALERDTSKVVIANGGKVVGSVRHPLNTADFSSFLLQAQSSKAKIIGLANAGGDTVNAIKQGRRIRHRLPRAAFRRPPRLHQRRRGAGAENRAGPRPHRDLVLGHDRRQSRLHQALAGGLEPARKIPEHAARGRLFVGDALFESGRGAQERQRRPRRGRQDERAADRRSAVRQRLDPHRRPQAARRAICSK